MYGGQTRCPSARQSPGVAAGSGVAAPPGNRCCGQEGGPPTALPPQQSCVSPTRNQRGAQPWAHMQTLWGGVQCLCGRCGSGRGSETLEPCPRGQGRCPRTDSRTNRQATDCGVPTTEPPCSCPCQRGTHGAHRQSGGCSQILLQTLPPARPAARPQGRALPTATDAQCTCLAAGPHGAAAFI